MKKNSYKGAGMTNRNVIISSAVLFSILVFFLGYSMTNLFAEQSPLGQSVKDLSKAELEKEVEKLVKGDEIVLRRNIDKVFKLADINEQEGADEKAIKLYESALRVNSANIPYQMKLARLLEKNGRKSDAIAAASTVHDLAEDNKLFEEAERLLKNNGEPIEKKSADIKVAQNVKIILILLGNPDLKLVAELKKMLEQKMGIEFIIYPKAKNIGKYDRTFANVFLMDYIKWLEERIGPHKFGIIKKELGYENEAFDSDEAKIKFLIVFFDRMGTSGKEARQDFERALEKESNHFQYSADRLLQEMGREYPIKWYDKVKGCLAITNEDLFTKESRFNFGAAHTGYGVVSYHRYTSAFNSEDQNRPRLLKRTLKQALSSANFVLGLPRCSNPNCARAYPNSLSEHDQKPDELCSVCRDKLNAYIKTQK